MSDASDQLVAQSCTPCRGGVPPLDPEEAESYLAQTPGWSLHDQAHRIEQTYRFKNFAAAYEFVKRVAALSEAEGHHPDIGFGWGYATISLQTKKIRGLHQNDFILAAKINRLSNEGGSSSSA
ncbi:4a-hydroxytetrahydrobiopterin dehydratase [Geminicoccus roseus]|uniref:4a-hydroxytetrahydrobiopterin dehydratase n=1 Tax=Geminicoccus roseus TaxID=404900 RepID=UPI0004076C41|nr:4a-hydroxytetrahydrobiopterin dehydratase [Geminicoccus roseus]